MDDNQFDKLFRDKLDELDPSYNSSFWDGFIAKYGAIIPITGIWSRRNMVLAGGLLLITLLNAFWAFNNFKTTQQVEKELSSNMQTGLQDPNIIADTDTVLITDTVFIEKFITRSDPSVSNFPDSYGTDYQNIGLSGSLQSPGNLNRNNFVNRNTSNKFLQESRLEFKLLQKIVPFGPTLNKPEFSPVVSYRGNSIIRQRARKPWMLHIGAGYGVKIPYTNPGTSYLDNAYNISFEIFKNPYHRLQTGISFFPMRYLLDDTSDPDKFSNQDLAGYPNLASLPHLPNQINVSNQLIQIPFYYRRYEYLTNSWAIFMGAGLTLDLLTEQQFDYTLLDIENREVKETNYREKNDQWGFYLGTIGGLFGISYELGDDWSVSSELNYQYGLSEIGLESQSFNHLNFNFMLNYHLD